jgi:hypothetical protein
MQSSNPSVDSQDGEAFKSSPSRSTLQRLPVWSKILIGLTASILVFFGYFIFRFADLAHDFSINATNPVKVAAIAKKIARFPQPLPEGYEFETAYSIGQDILNIRHKPDGQTVTFLSGPYTQEDSKKALDRVSGQPIGGRALFAPMEKEKSRGELTIGGETMPYIVGEFGSKETTGQIVEGLIGCLSLKKQGKTIIINALPGAGSSYNLKVTTDLLQSIEGFEGTK